MVVVVGGGGALFLGGKCGEATEASTSIVSADTTLVNRMTREEEASLWNPKRYSSFFLSCLGGGGFVVEFMTGVLPLQLCERQA